MFEASESDTAKPTAFPRRYVAGSILFLSGMLLAGCALLASASTGSLLTFIVLLVPILLGLGLAILNLAAILISSTWQRFGQAAGLAMTCACMPVLWGLWHSSTRDPYEAINDRIDSVERAVTSGSARDVDKAFKACGRYCDEQHWTRAFNRAAVLGHVEELRFIAARSPYPLSTLDRVTNDGFRLCPGFGHDDSMNAMIAALFGSDGSVTKVVLDAASKDDLDVGLQYAVESDRVDLIDLLIRRGADVHRHLNPEPDSKDTPTYPLRNDSLLDLAIANRSLQTTRHLLELGIPALGTATLSTRRWTTIHEWVATSAILEVRQGHVESMLPLLDALATPEAMREAGEVNALPYDCGHCSPMDLAIEMDAPLVVQILAGKGIARTQKPDERDKMLAQAANTSWRAAQRLRSEKTYGNDDGSRPCVQEALRSVAATTRH